MHHASAKRLRPFLLAALAALAAPGAAQAHRLTTVAVDYRVRVLAPDSGAVAAKATDGGRKLELSVPVPRVVTVLGYEREPFLRFSSKGVEVRSGSPTAQALGLVSQGAEGWAVLTTAHSFAWADQRLVPPPTGGRTTWRVPLLVNGRRSDVSGISWREPRPSGWAWLAGGTGLLAGAAVLLFRARRPFAALALAVLASAAATASLTGIALTGIGSAPSRWFQVAAVGGVGLAGIAFALRKHGAAPVALGLGAIVAAAEGLAQVGIFRHPVVLSALPADCARAAVTVALACGLAVTIYSALGSEAEEAR